jgi:hypothetical protein
MLAAFVDDFDPIGRQGALQSPLNSLGRIHQ